MNRLSAGQSAWDGLADMKQGVERDRAKDDVAVLTRRPSDTLDRVIEPKERFRRVPRERALAIVSPTESVSDRMSSAPTSETDDRSAKRELTPNLLKRRLVFADLFAVMFGIAAAFVLQAVFEPARSASVSWQMALSVPVVPVIIATAAMRNLYTARATRRATEEFRHVVVATFAGTSSIVLFSFALTFGSLSRFWVGAVFACVVVSLSIERRIARSIFHRLRCSGRLTRRTVIIGADAGAARLARTLYKRPDLGFTAMGFVGEGHASLLTGLPKLGELDDIQHIVEDTASSGVIISMSAVDYYSVNALARQLTDAGIHVTLSTALEDIHIGRLRTYELDGRAMIYIEPTIRTGWRRHAKRVFDVAGALIGLTLTAPILLAAMVAIRLESSGPILFKQNRVGLNGEIFRIFKLRTMVVDAEAIQSDLADQNESDGPLFKIRQDPRITRVGRVLRTTSIDELPQFWNVLRGEMSFVGPRPRHHGQMASFRSGLDHVRGIHAPRSSLRRQLVAHAGPANRSEDHRRRCSRQRRELTDGSSSKIRARISQVGASACR